MKKILLLVLCTIGAFAQTPDPNFGVNGVVNKTISNTPPYDMIYDAVIQPDGKIIFVGESRVSDVNITPFIIRYNDYMPDTNFNIRRYIKTNNYINQAIALQNDGKFLVGGGYRVARYLSNGNLDTSFNTNGELAIIRPGYPSLYIKDISLQNDGKIVVSGSFEMYQNTHFGIARINSNGSLDTTFGDNGIVKRDLSLTIDRAYSHKIQTDGKIVVFGEIYNGTNYDFGLIRLNTDGTLDTTFGDNGKTITAFTTGNDFGRSGEILPDGKMLLFGSASGKFALARYTSSGILDTSFGTNGKLILNHNLEIPTNDIKSQIPRLKLSMDGKILLTGSSDNDFKIIKLLMDGSYDASFDEDGIITFNYDQRKGIPTALLEKADGKIVVLGSSNTPDVNDANFTLIEMNANGSNGSIGFTSLYFSYDKTVASAVRMSDGAIFTLSKSNVHNNGRLILSKFLANGNRDTNFGNFYGYVDLGTPGLWAEDGNIRMRLFPDSKILIALNETMLYRINQNGNLDGTFGTSGTLNLATYDNRITFINRIIVSNDNKILIAADYTLPNGNGETAVLKLNLNGTLDTTFGTNGIVHYGFSSTPQLIYGWPSTVVQDTSGKIITTSISRVQGSHNNTKIGIAKLNPNGTFDTTFGTNGKYIYESSFDIEPGREVALSPTNDILVPLYFEASDNPGQIAFGTLKVTANGNLDTSFGNNGVLYDNIGMSMLVRPNGKILKAGNFNEKYKIVQYNPNGSIDTTFGNGGSLVHQEGTADFEALLTNLIPLPNDGLLVTGTSFNGERTRIMFVKYTNLNLGLVDLTEKQNTALVYPNPIASEAKLEYSLNSTETMSITIYDLQGRTVQQIVKNQEQQPGKHTVDFSMDQNISAGNYFLVLSSEKGKQTIQILKK